MSAFDLVVTGGTVIDGTGAAGRPADVGVRGGRIAEVAAPGALAGDAAERVDATDRVVMPGVVDLHTHYDAQLAWDPTASPSPLHGVTTVVGGNCGFGLAPAGDEHAPYLARLMARVEGIPLEAIEAGVGWSWRGFGDWTASLEAGGMAINAGFLAGHCALRRVAMGERAVGETATAADVAAMVALLHDALDAGALGFSTSRSHTHHDGDRNPVPSRAAGDDELLALCAAVRDHPGTQLEAIVPGCINGFSGDEQQLLAAMSVAAQRPLNWNVLGVAGGDHHLAQLAASDVAAQVGGRVVALTLPQGMRIRLSFVSGMVLDALPGWAETLFALPPPQRLAALADADVRRRLDAGAQSPDAGIIGLLANWSRLRIVETFSDATAAYEGRRVGDIAAERGVDPFDALCDIVVADELRTGISPEMPPEPPEVWQARLAAWRDPRTLVGGSDAGAHLDMMCGAAYSTFLLGPAVRDLELLAIEEAVHLLTGAPADFYGLADRGRLVPGAAADLAVVDPATVGPGAERTVADLPGGASRIVADAHGVGDVVVAGTAIVRHGTFTGATPGRVLRSGTDTATVGLSP
ncbi:MAG: amidohydrolase family protein [Acidimicrobiales bacterium]|nr:amidohydrolase family protein [Acidimicrobiales bacterium]